jgi:hypothetical protein
MSDDKSLFLTDRTKLRWFPKNYKYYLNKTTIIYGRTNSGKSTIIEEIMYMCKKYVPTVFVIAPTNSSNNAYTDKIPAPFIFKELDVEWLDKLLTRQKNSAGAYINANKLDMLKRLFDKVSDSTSQALELSIVNKAGSSIIVIEESNMEFSNKKCQKSQILEDRDSMLKKLYKTTIRFNKVTLENSTSLNKSELAALSFLDFNPNIMLILDDCASKFKKLYKKSSAIKEIFYEGRHYFFTTLISSQDDKEIDSELRKNTTISIYTTAQSATSNFERASNGYPKHEKIRAKHCIDAVFKQDDNDLKHHRKLVYIQNESDGFFYTIANLYDEFRMGSLPMWEYAERIGKKYDTFNKNNRLIDSYVNK